MAQAPCCCVRMFAAVLRLAHRLLCCDWLTCCTCQTHQWVMYQHSSSWPVIHSALMPSTILPQFAAGGTRAAAGARRRVGAAARGVGLPARPAGAAGEGLGMPRGGMFWRWLMWPFHRLPGKRLSAYQHQKTTLSCLQPFASAGGLARRGPGAACPLLRRRCG